MRSGGGCGGGGGSSERPDWYDEEIESRHVCYLEVESKGRSGVGVKLTSLKLKKGGNKNKK